MSGGWNLNLPVNIRSFILSTRAHSTAFYDHWMTEKLHRISHLTAARTFNEKLARRRKVFVAFNWTKCKRIVHRENIMKNNFHRHFRRECVGGALRLAGKLFLFILEFEWHFLVPKRVKNQKLQRNIAPNFRFHLHHFSHFSFWFMFWFGVKRKSNYCLALTLNSFQFRQFTMFSLLTIKRRRLYEFSFAFHFPLVCSLCKREQKLNFNFHITAHAFIVNFHHFFFTQKDFPTFLFIPMDHLLMIFLGRLSMTFGTLHKSICMLMTLAGCWFIHFNRGKKIISLALKWKKFP